MERKRTPSPAMTPKRSAQQKELREVESYLSKPRAMLLVDEYATDDAGDSTFGAPSKAADVGTAQVRFAVLSGMGYTVQWVSGVAHDVVGQCPLAAVTDVFSDEEQLVLTVKQQSGLETVTLLRPPSARWEPAWIEAGLNYLRGV
jgi:hypothetical protein